MTDDLKVTSIIVKPVISEKSFALIEQGVYPFYVNKKASKFDIKMAIEKAFSVKVIDVNTLNSKGKKIRNLRTGKYGKRPDRKKAYVRLFPGQKISAFDDIKG